MRKLLVMLAALTARTSRALVARAASRRPRAALRAAKKSTQLTTTNFEAAAASVVAKPQRLPLPAKTRKTVAFNQQYLCAGCGSKQPHWNTGTTSVALDAWTLVTGSCLCLRLCPEWHVGQHLDSHMPVVCACALDCTLGSIGTCWCPCSCLCPGRHVE